MCHMSHILLVNQDSVLGHIHPSATLNFKDIRATTISFKMIKVPRRQHEGDLLTFSEMVWPSTGNSFLLLIHYFALVSKMRGQCDNLWSKKNSKVLSWSPNIMQILLLLIFTKFAKFLTISHIQSLYSLVVRKNYLDLIIMMLMSYNYYYVDVIQYYYVDVLQLLQCWCHTIIIMLMSYNYYYVYVIQLLLGEGAK